MDSSRGFVRSSIGRKVIMASTGVILVLYVIAHMLGNLQVYGGPEGINAYGRFLHTFLHGQAIWIARAVLLAAVLLHIWSATSLTLTSRKARAVGYRERQWTDSTYASRTMRWGGVIILLFVIYHILHFTTGTVHPDFVPGDVYHNFVAGFRIVPVSIAYIVAMIALGLHLRHGVWSMFQTLGVSHPRYIRAAHVGAWVVAILVTAGNISFPLAVLAGIVK
jgi:succinate dehydrogenase / fumarate reductase cytochrome b subunit